MPPRADFRRVLVNTQIGLIFGVEPVLEVELFPRAVFVAKQVVRCPRRGFTTAGDWPPEKNSGQQPG